MSGRGGAVTLHEGDALAVLATLDSGSVDAVVTDPPAGIGFMGKTWDEFKTAKPGQNSGGFFNHSGDARLGGSVAKYDRATFIAAMTAIFTECHRVLKPGGHAFVWALPRTSHWTATALEDAGFEIRDVVVHLFGSGFPKSLDISKAIDKAARRDYVLAAVKLGLDVPGRSFDDWTKEAHSPSDKAWETFKAVLSHDEWQRVEREVVGTDRCSAARIAYVRETGGEFNLTAPATPDAARWNGWGTALKPASEHWILCRKPLSEPTVAANVLAHGVGGLNVGACRVEAVGGLTPGGRHTESSPNPMNRAADLREQRPRAEEHPAGRWPPNVAVSHNDDCEQVGVRRVKSNERPAHDGKVYAGPGTERVYGEHAPESYTVRYAAPDGTETVPAWRCSEGCAVAMLDHQSGERPSRAGTTKKSKGNGYGVYRSLSDSISYGSDTGGASRFFYTAKASRSERNAGLNGMPKSFLATMGDGIGAREHNPEQPTAWAANDHPTVKPIALMRWLCRLITPPGGTVLDCFMGSGTTGCAAVLEGFTFIGIEGGCPESAHYLDIARRRIAYWAAQGTTPAKPTPRPRPPRVAAWAAPLRQGDMFAETPA